MQRPNREHESLVGEQGRIVNRMKAALIRLGIRGFNRKLKKAAERLDGLRTPRASRSRPTPWLSCVATCAPAAHQRSDNADRGRLRGASQASARHGPYAMVHLLARVIGVGVEAADMLVKQGLSPKHARPTGRSALCRPHGLAR